LLKDFAYINHMNHIQAYVTGLQKEFASGIAAEHAYRPALKTLIESVADKILAVNDPKRQTCGAPDFVVRKGEIDVGYIEAKDVNIGLDKVEKSEQMKRYLASRNYKTENMPNWLYCREKIRQIGK